MEKINKLTKNIKTIESKILESKILLLVHDEIKYQRIVERLMFLLSESKTLLNDYTKNKQEIQFNYIDNNCFEMEQLLEDLKVELDRFIKIDTYVYLQNKQIDELYNMLSYYETVLEVEGTIFNAIRQIKQYAKTLIYDYVKDIQSYLEKYESPKVQSILNINYLESILEHYLITTNDWRQVNKMTKFAIKSIENKNSEYFELLAKQIKFEYAYFLVMVGE